MKGIPVEPWLDPTEINELCEQLLHAGIIKFSNARDLPLKSGGATDIYLNMRDARSNPEVNRIISDAFENPLRRLGLDRFVEVPDAVSCFAGVISVRTGLPYITIRETAKVGRVTKGTMIGAFRRGDSVAILDDVVTDGRSKIIPYRECVANGLNVRGLVVLVDRQQGWEQTFAREGLNLAVWPGMYLHDVRRNLIESGAMQRCDPHVEQKNPIIVALDGMSWEQMLPVVDKLRTMGCILKVNDMLFGRGIEQLLPHLKVYGRVMADLKCHDIPRTVANTCEYLRRCPPWAVTVHGSGSGAMVEAAVQTLAGTETKVLAVTVLTSLDPTTCAEIYHRQPWGEVKTLAQIAMRAGAHGLVCSPREVARLRKLYPNAELVTPGVRSAGAKVDDQKRIETPSYAIGNGANHIVMGSQLFGAPDPVAEVSRVTRDELNITL